MTGRHNFHSSHRVVQVVAITNVGMVWLGLIRIIFHRFPLLYQKMV